MASRNNRASSTSSLPVTRGLLPNFALLLAFVTRRVEYCPKRDLGHLPICVRPAPSTPTSLTTRGQIVRDDLESGDRGRVRADRGLLSGVLHGGHHIVFVGSSAMRARSPSRGRWDCEKADVAACLEAASDSKQTDAEVRRRDRMCDVQGNEAGDNRSTFLIIAGTNDGDRIRLDVFQSIDLNCVGVKCRARPSSAQLVGRRADLLLSHCLLWTTLFNPLLTIVRESQNRQLGHIDDGRSSKSNAL
jgi:hypothetical protein